MNTENLHKLIDRYEEDFYVLNNSEHNEIFKWRAAQQFRDVWFSDEAKTMPFSEKFNSAKKKFSILTDNSYVSPSNGIVKIAERDQDAVQRLFEETLFSNDGGNIIARQNNMDKFLEGFDKLRMKYYPQSFKFKQERHAASCYLAFFAPDDNYIYRSRDAEEFAQNVEFGKDIGFGRNFRLDYYYELCDAVVAALKEHPTLLKKHFSFLSDDCYRDESLHLLAFDLIYCCRTYNFYSGMIHATKKESIQAFAEAQAREKERLERERQIAKLTDDLRALEIQKEQYESISLLNVEVFQSGHGKGIVTAQQGNKITVKFETCEKVFAIHKKYPMRPKFENDAEITEVFTEYDRLCRKTDMLKRKLNELLSRNCNTSRIQ